MKQSLNSRMFKIVGAAAVAGMATSTSAFAQIVIVPSTTPFVDILATGTNVGAASDDSEINITSTQLSAAGFNGNELLPLAGIRVGNNGGVLWNAATGDVGYINSTTFPTMAGANTATMGNGGAQPGVSFLVPLWDDNVPSTGQGANAQRWQVIGGNLILEWTNEDHFNASGTGTVTYEAIIYGGVTIASGLPLVDFVYNDTLYAAMQYQNDGGSATIGYKNWGTVANANDVQYGTGGGNDTIGDPAFGGANMQPKVAGYLANENPNLPHSLTIKGNPPPPLPTKYCRGDGTGTACPCNNSGASGNGCANASDPNGAALDFSGVASVAADTFTLTNSGAPATAPVLFFQGTTQVNGGLGTPFGDGLVCAGGTQVRLGPKHSVAGVSSYPEAGDQPISVKGGVSAGDQRNYQAFYRDATPGFCTTDLFNFSNGVAVTWLP
jgi:hypothetical protein